MEASVLDSNKVEFDHSLLKDKHFFAGYLNLANNNIDRVLKTYKVRFEVKANEKDNFSIIDNSITEKLSEPDYINRIEFLKLHFPVVGYLDLPATDDLFKNEIDKNLARRFYFKEKFKVLVKAIDSLRNFYTHYYHKSLPFNEVLFALVDNIFLQVILDVKRQKKKNDHTRELLKQSLKEELDILYQFKKQDLENKKAQGKRVNLESESIHSGIFNDAFFHLLYKKDNLNSYYKSAITDVESMENSISISQNGLLFLLGMFLSKRESEDLRARVKGFKGKVIKDKPDFPSIQNNSLRFMATHWVFSYLAYKGIKKKLNTNFIKETLLIQIIDELSKVPSEVYDNLPFEKQQLFVEDINEFIREGNETLSLEDSIVIHPVIRKRYENKFNYFVLRYLDEFVDFPSLRFQIYLGNYVHDRRIKNIDGTKFETDRIVKEKINVFSRLSEVSNLKDNYITKRPSQEGSLGWEIFPNPSYNFVSENIPIFINLQKSNVPGARKLFGELISKKNNLAKERENEGQQIVRSADKVNKLEITRLIDEQIQDGSFEKVYIGQPTAILSLNELPALLYELLIKKTTPQAIEDILIQKLLNHFKIIEEYDSSMPLSTSQITKKLKKGEGQDTIDIQKLAKAINDEIDVCDTKLLKILENRKEVRSFKSKRKFVFTNYELGKEASWLADDLIRFMPKDSRKKWKGYQHSQLQRSLAYFNQDSKEAFELLKPNWDFSDINYIYNNGIKNAFTSGKTFDMLLEKYLYNRKTTLNAIYDGINSFRNNKKMFAKLIAQHHVWNLFGERFYIIKSVESQKKELLAKPLVFPRGIFDTKPTFIKNRKITETPQEFADWYQYTYEKHDYQRFYELERDYLDLFSTEQLVNQSIIGNKKGLTVKEQFDLFKLKQDLKIKKVKTNDLFLKLVAEDIYGKLLNHEITFLLSELYLTQHERLVKENNARKQSQRDKDDKSENIVNDNFIWSKMIPLDVPQFTVTDVKLKDVGKFKRFLSDNKVERILSYDENRVWTKLEMEDELFIKPTSYETIRREELLKEIHVFEKNVLVNYGCSENKHHADLESLKGDPNFKSYVVNGVLNKMNLGLDADILWLKTCKDDDFENLPIDELRSKPLIIQKAFLLILIRNKFAHNQLPKAPFYRHIKSLVNEDKEVNASSSTIILKFTKRVIEEFSV